MHVRCPHCHDAVEIAEEASLSQISCASCGTEFSLLVEETLSWGAGGQKKVGRFELVDQIGVGSFGSVWKAYDPELDRTVAVKIPRKDNIGPQETEQFLREARAAAQLAHPSIVGVHEVGREGDSVYIVSDFIQGVTLNDWLTGQQPTIRQAARLCARLAEALHHAHEAGVIHRDLKPSNIMLDGEGQPHIMDFGLARRECGDVTMTVDGKVLGTPAYMSPEQARGEAHQADRRSDVYSLGVILFELLTGHKPFRGNMRMLIHQVINDEPPSPRKLNGGVPRDLETICLKCLRKEPGRRYGTAADLADDLQRWLNHEPIKARPVGLVQRLVSWRRRNPLVAALSTVAVLLLAAVAIVSLAGYVATSRALGIAQEQTEIANDQSEKARDAQRSAEETLTDMYAFTGLVAGERGEPGQAALWFAAAAQQSRDDEVRRQANQVRYWNWLRQTPTPSFAVDYGDLSVKRIDFHPVRPLLLVLHSEQNQPGCTVWNFEQNETLDFPNRERRVTEAAWSPDGESLAVAYAEGAVELLRVPSGETAQSFAHGEWVTDLQFSRDGRLLAIAGKQIRVWDLAAPERPLAEFAHPHDAEEVTFNSRGDRLAAAYADGLVRVFAIAGETSGELPFSPLAGRNPVHEPLLPPVFVGSEEGLIAPTERSIAAWWDAASGAKVASLYLNRITVIEPDSTGRYVMMGGLSDGQLWDVATRQPIGQALRHQNQIFAASFSADGRILLTAAVDRSARLWSVPSGEPLSPWIRHTDMVHHGDLSPDGKRIATAQADGLIRLWRVPDRAWSREIQLDATANFRLRMAPDGRHILPGGWNRERWATSARVYDALAGKAAGPVLEARGLVNDCDFAPDGKHAVTLCSLKDHVDQLHPMDIRFAKQEGWIQFWNWTTAEEPLDALRTQTEPIRCRYSPDGTTLVVVCAGGQVLLVDPTTGRVRAERSLEGPASAHQNLLTGVEFSPDGKLFLTCGWGAVVQLWETQTGELVYSFRHNGRLCLDARFSADGRFLATAADDYAVRVWETATGQLESPPLKHPDIVFRVCFSPDGDRILTAGRDNSARLWDWKSGQLVCPALAHGDEVFGVAFSGDGRWLLTTCRDRTARFWEGRTGKPVTPPLPLSGNGYWGYEIEITPDGRQAVVAGDSLHVFDMQDLLHWAAGRMDPEGLRLLGELVCAQRTQGGGVVNLTTAEWLSRWQSLQERIATSAEPGGG